MAREVVCVACGEVHGLPGGVLTVSVAEGEGSALWQCGIQKNVGEQKSTARESGSISMGWNVERFPHQCTLLLCVSRPSQRG